VAGHSKGIDVSGAPADRYRIVGRIAAGGMAEIYLARTTNKAGAEREVVLKRLLPELQSDHEFVQMFHDEARIASQLNHPNIVQIYELGELDGSLFIAMELLRGVNLRDLLARLHTTNKQLSPHLAVRIACEALAGLHYAHNFTDARGRKLNVVHRDVSPQNILITYEGNVKLVDFGVAKAEGKLHQTRAGLVKGKFAYMSPEQVSGGQLDGRSDLFALAEVFYELMLRRHPFYAQTDMDVLRAILDADPPHPSALDQNFPAALGAIFMRALKKRQGDRYPDAGAMQEALERFLLEQRTPATTAMLGRFVKEIFADKMDAEARARAKGDDDALIEAMTAGRAEYIKSMGKGAIPRFQSGELPPMAAEDEVSGGATVIKTEDDGRGRHRVVEVSMRGSNGAADPAERPAPILAKEESTGSRLRDEVRQLFSGVVDSVPPAGGHVEEDAAEMPTLLGHFSPADLAEVRGAAEEARRKKAGGATNIKVEPAEKRAAPVVTRAPADPADAPTAGEPPARGAPAAPVTTRSPTQVVTDDEPPQKRTDRVGIFFFIAGLGALLGAIVYAVVLLNQPRLPTMTLVIQSTPEGAAIVLDGNDIGARTPQVIPNIASDKAHKLELRLDGHVSYEHTIEPAQNLGEYVIDWRFKPLPGAKHAEPQ
jgi:eukaryotic-like serine/threonine-protein kinase